MSVLETPSLGPWFINAPLELPAPNGSLGLALDVTSSTWVAPVQGLVSLAIAPSPLLAPLRDHKGDPAFANDSFVVVLRLLPAVEARLAKLTGRARVRSLALALPAAPAPDKLGVDVLKGLGPSSDVKGKERALAFGLGSDGTKLLAGGAPVQALRQQGNELLKWSGKATLWAFDADGHALDPGAVAAWWSALSSNAGVAWTGTATNLAPARTVHLVQPGEAGLGDSALENRLSLTSLTGGAGLYSATTSPTPPAVGRKDTTDANLRVALLPQGPYADAAPITWTGARDFVRVGVVDVEPFLVGVARTATRDDMPSQGDTRTRVDVARCADTGTTAALCATGEQALEALFWAIERPAQSGQAWVVGGVASATTGPLDAALANALLAKPLPTAAPALEAAALAGSGQEQNGRILGQRALLTVRLDGDLQGAWVRVWPHRLDLESGLRVRMNGGGGLAVASSAVGSDGAAHPIGLARVVVTLPDANSNMSAAPLSADVLVVTRAADGRLQSRLFVDQRFTRPRVEPPAPAPPNAPWHVCETGASGAGAPSNVPSGATVVLLPNGQTPQLFRPPLAAHAATTLGRALTDEGDRLTLVEPAFPTRPDHLAADGRLSAVRGTPAEGFPRPAAYVARKPLDPTIPTVAPAGLERFEIAAICTHLESTNRVVDRAALLTTPLLACFHEPADARLGHPGAPACAETHGTGVRLAGPAALLLAEHVRDRSFPLTPALAFDAALPLKSNVAVDPAKPSRWAAVLKTGAKRLDVEPGVPAIVDALRPLVKEKLHDLLQQLGASNLPVTFPDDQAESLFRALERRLGLAKYGAREGQRAIAAALRRAERFVYIETPALRTGTEVFDALTTRLGDRPGLQVLLCLPAAPQVGTPPALRALEAHLLRAAVRDLLQAAPGRVVAFAPTAGGERPLRLSSTSVVVDDVLAFTGSTHLSRRGLTFDGSLMVALFDETLDDGRPREVRAFRRALLQARLGLTAGLLPEDPAELLDLVQREQARGGSRVARVPDLPKMPADFPTTNDLDRLDPDGAASTVDFNTLLSLALSLGEPSTDPVADADEIELPASP